jgi:two-component system sensor histidine kinase ResE
MGAQAAHASPPFPQATQAHGSAPRPPQDVLSVIGHDLKDPLSAITMGASLLLKTVPREDERTRRVLEAMSRAAGRMEVLIRNALDLTRLGAGLFELHTQPQSLRDLLDHALRELETLASHSGVTIEHSFTVGDANVVCDAHRITQVMLLLGDNAIKYGGGKPIGVHAALGTATVEISVSDAGPGLAEERLRTVFDWLSNATRPARDGPGLGLAVAKGIVEAHQGSITVKSRLGQGTTFCFTLPLRPTA